MIPFEVCYFIKFDMAIMKVLQLCFIYFLIAKKKINK